MLRSVRILRRVLKTYCHLESSEKPTTNAGMKNLQRIIITIIISECGACGVMVIVVGNGHGDTSSNPGQDWLHFT